MISYAMPWRLSAALFVLLVGCFPTEEIDPSSLPDGVSIDGYEGWSKVEPLLGPVPAHGDTYRILYVNDTARAYTGGGFYQDGSTMVKEIYTLDGEAGRGDLDYTAVMRRIDEDSEPDLPIQDGWLFTNLGTDGVETHSPLCWDSCHRQAPYQGAWFDYSRW